MAVTTKVHKGFTDLARELDLPGGLFRLLRAGAANNTGHKNKRKNSGAVVGLTYVVDMPGLGRRQLLLTAQQRGP
eukprot:CAMPEP_0117660636 /NCGR_PEP_ID=MMETSP0804-20121206/7072_1 /TAXON_ID=1074897 /ORGANISM="Tetraselmis astigmatica, Strain CCMP880" /LENGTH=74 /DNA_ID=CAMNT_0005467375 /DNA_START=140 /DNA_END=364 /DNA_ORIENTATION=+